MKILNINDISNSLPEILFIIKSTTMKFIGYDLKNVPTSTGRADVLARFISSALLEPRKINSEIGVIIYFNDNFYDELSNFLINNAGNQSTSDNQPTNFGVSITKNSPFLKKFNFQNNSLDRIHDDGYEINRITEHNILDSLYNSCKQINNEDNVDNMDDENSLFDFVINVAYTDLISKFLGSDNSVYILIEDATTDINELDLKEIRKNNIIIPENKNRKLIFLIGDQVGFSNNPILDDNRIMRVKIGKEPLLASSVVNFIKYQLYKE